MVTIHKLSLEVVKLLFVLSFVYNSACQFDNVCCCSGFNCTTCSSTTNPPCCLNGCPTLEQAPYWVELLIVSCVAAMLAFCTIAMIVLGSIIQVKHRGGLMGSSATNYQKIPVME